MHRIFVGKDTHKFSCAHMTVFPDGSKERMHGHNFEVRLAFDLRRVQFGDMLDFGVVKKSLQAQCDAWTEHLLLAAESPHLQLLNDDGEELEFTLCKKRYVVPRDDVILLPLDNIVVETLAVAFARALRSRLGPLLRPDIVTGMEVSISESSGQGATHYLALPEGALPFAATEEES